MEIDPSYFHPSGANWEMRDIAADVIQSWFDDLSSIEGACERKRPMRRFKATLPDHEDIGSVPAAIAFIAQGREWFRVGRFWGWSAVLHYTDETCAVIVAKYERRASELEQRLRAVGAA